MIAFLRGVLAARTATSAFVDVGGVGYAVAMSQNALAKLPEQGQEVRILTFMHVSENAVALYGFLSPEEQGMFERLITVSGIGPKVALAALSTFSPSALAEAIATQDASAVSRIPGVGKKTASRIILELKGSLDLEGGTLFEAAAPLRAESAAKGATEALLSMGFTSAEAELALKGASEEASEAALLQYALKRLGSR